MWILIPPTVGNARRILYGDYPLELFFSFSFYLFSFSFIFFIYSLCYTLQFFSRHAIGVIAYVYIRFSSPCTRFKRSTTIRSSIYLLATCFKINVSANCNIHRDEISCRSYARLYRNQTTYNFIQIISKLSRNRFTRRKNQCARVASFKR